MISTNVKNVIQEFMKSRYFLWKENFRDEVLVNENGKEIYVNWNFHGLYDAEKLLPSDFDKIGFTNFIFQFLTYIKVKIGLNIGLQEIQNTLIDHNVSGNIYYLLKDLPESKLHKWSVFEFYISGLVINFLNKKISLIEFGRD